jgi:hypothetical protein
VLEEKGLPLEPDLVILESCPATDVYNALAQVDKFLRSYEPWYPTDVAWCRAQHFVLTHIAVRLRRWSRAVAHAQAVFGPPRSPLIPYLRPKCRAWQPSIPPSEDERPF